VRFGNDKEKFILETIHDHENVGQDQQQQQHAPNPAALSPVQESMTHGGMIAGRTSEHGDRMRVLGDGSPSAYGQAPAQLPLQQQQAPAGYQQQQQAPPRPQPPAPVGRSETARSAAGGQAWQISFPTADGNAVRRSNEFAAPPVPAPPPPTVPADQNASAFGIDPADDPYAPARKVVDDGFEVNARARNIYGGTMGGAGGGAATSPPRSNPMASSLPAMAVPPRPLPGGGDHGASQPLPNSPPPVAWGEAPMQMPVQQQIPVERYAPGQMPMQPQQQGFARDSMDEGEFKVRARPPHFFSFCGDPLTILFFKGLAEAPRLPNANELPPTDHAHSLTASERAAIVAEKQAAAKHMRDLNMLLAGTIDPREVEFVFTEPGACTPGPPRLSPLTHLR
jgi:hypothetical protein